MVLVCDMVLEGYWYWIWYWYLYNTGHCDGSSDGYCIGHSFFCPTNNDLSYGIDWYKKVIDNQIIPLLEEYYFDRPEKVEELRAELLS